MQEKMRARLRDAPWRVKFTQPSPCIFLHFCIHVCTGRRIFFVSLMMWTVEQFFASIGHLDTIFDSSGTALK